MTDSTIDRRAGFQAPPGVLMLLLLAPVAAVDTSTRAGLGLALGVAIVLAIGGLVSRSTRASLPPEIRLGIIAVSSTAAMAVLDLALAAWLPDWHETLAGNLPLIAACSLAVAGGLSLARDSRVPHPVAVDVATVGQCVVALVALGAARDWLGHYSRLALQPSGALLLLGAGLATFNHLRARRMPGDGEAAPT